MEGGLPGSPGSFTLEDGTPLNPKRTVEIAPEAVVVITTPGGGGLGSPLERDPELVRRDVQDGLVSADLAAASYRVAMDGAGSVDPIETARLRREARIKEPVA